MPEREPKPGDFLVSRSWVETHPGGRNLVYGEMAYFETFEEAQRYRADSLGQTGWMPTGAHTPEVSWVQRAHRRSTMGMGVRPPGELSPAENGRRMGELRAVQASWDGEPGSLQPRLDARLKAWETQRRDGSGMPATAETEEAEARAGLSWRRAEPSPVGVATQPRMAPSPNEPF